MTRRRIGALVFDGFEMLDLYGPLEMFAMHPDAIEIVAVAETDAPQKASGGPATQPDATLASGGMFDILLVPGGAGTRQAIHRPAVLDWLRAQAQAAELVTSVCTGAVLLARAGCLDGHKATTNKLAFDWVADQAPQVDWQRRARWVESGKVFTASGVSAGIDMSLAVISRLLGEAAAEQAALEAEYLRNRDPGNDPFSRPKET